MRNYRKLIRLPLLAAFILVHFTILGQVNQPATWQSCTTAEEVYALYPAQIKQLFSELDLDQVGEEPIRDAIRAGQYASAGKLLADYYRKKSTGHFFTVLQDSFSQQIASDALQDVFTITGHTAKVPRLHGGGLDWNWSPSDYPNNQWKQITRHRWLNDLLYASLATGNTEYARHLDATLRDWCINTNGVNLPTGSKLDPGCRMDEWPQVFYSFLPSDTFSDATILLMLHTLHKHGEWLADRQNWSIVNRLVTQLTGLMKVSLGFPEFRDAANWFVVANEGLQAELSEQILSDGAQYELSHNYHQVVMEQYLELKKLFQQAGRPFPQQMQDIIESGINYTANVLNPRMQGLMNNDSDEKSLREWLLDKATTYHRQDWLYIATNGEKGTKPVGGPSKMFPSAGHFISRSSWKANANWAFFDVGPWGMDHQHNDKLHLSVYAHGRPLLVDAGRYTYKKDEWRAYFRGSQSHNVILINGQGQNGYEKQLDSAFTDYEFSEQTDFCIGNYSAGWGDQQGKHTRALVSINGKYWLVFDRIETDDTASVTALWHFDPACHVVQDGQQVQSDDAGKGNLLISPISDLEWAVAVRRGAVDTLQGWYSKSSGQKAPSYCAEYSIPIKKNQTFAWLLYPKNGLINTQEVSTRIIEQTDDYMRVLVKDADSQYEVTVNLSGTANPIRLGNGALLQARYAVIPN